MKIEPTRDKNALKQAYRKQLVTVHPEDDPEGFRQLRAAYEDALFQADHPEQGELEKTLDAGQKPQQQAFPDTPRGNMEKAMHELYASFFRRVRVEEWEALLNTPFASFIDTSEEAMILLLDFIAGHYKLPHQVFKFLGQHYDLNELREELLGRYPLRYIDFILTNGTYPDPIDHTKFTGPEDYDYDRIIDLSMEFSRALKTGDRETQERLRPVLTGLPVKNPDIDVMLARSLWQMDRKEEAEQCLRELAQEYPEDATLLISRGDMRLNSGHPEEAKEFYLKAKKCGGDTRILKGRMGELANAMGEHETARDIFYDLLKNDPYDAYFRSEAVKAAEAIVRNKKGMLGLPCEEEEDEREEEEETGGLAEKQRKEQIIDKEKDSSLKPGEEPSSVPELTEAERVKTGIELAMALYQSYHFEEAVDTLRAMDPPEGVPATNYHGYMGRCLISLNQAEEGEQEIRRWIDAILAIPAEDESEDAAAARKRMGYALTMLAVACMQQRRYDEARTALNSALTMNHEEYAVSLEEFCTLEYMDGHYAEAIQACIELEKRSPRNFQGSNIRAKCSLELGLQQEALEYAERAVECFPYVAEPHYVMAKVMLAERKYEDAEQIAARYLTINPESDTALIIRARVAIEGRNDWRTALELLQSVEEHVSGRNTDVEQKDEYYLLLGDVYRKLEEPHKALQAYENGVKDNPRNYRGLERLGDIHRRLLHYEKAVLWFSRQEMLRRSDRVLLNQSYCLLQLGRGDEARKKALEALELLEEGAATAVVAARLLYSLKKPADVLRAVEIAENFHAEEYETDLLQLKIRALIMQKDYTEADRILRGLNPSLRSESFFEEEVRLLTLTGRFDEAVMLLNVRSWNRETLSRKYDLLCEIRYRDGDLEELDRLIHVAEGLEAQGEKVVTALQYELLGHLQLIRKKYSAAEQSFLTAANRGPEKKYRYMGFLAECAARQFGGKSRMQRYIASLERTENSGLSGREAKIRLAQGLRAGKEYERAEALLNEVIDSLAWTGEINDMVSEAYEQLGLLFLARKQRQRALLALENARDARGTDLPLSEMITKLKNGN